MKLGAQLQRLAFLWAFGFTASGETALPMRTEALPVEGGAELVTVFGTIRQLAGEAADVPLLSVLRDTLGDTDPANDRLRYVWLHGYARRPLGRKILAGLPFVYRSGGRAPNPAGQPPATLLDLGAGARGTWGGLLVQGLQSFWLDPAGLPMRAPTRSYRGNIGDFRNTRLIEAAWLVRRLERMPGASTALRLDELKNIQARLMLSGTLLGGLVNDCTLPRIHARDTERTHLHRGRNWELLRQRAEKNRLPFEPLGDSGDDPTHAMLWIAKSELSGDPHPYDSKFLAIADPWRDPRLKQWKGYTETWTFDAEGRKLAGGVEGERREEMIPLALYSLDYPKVPLLMVDFRDGSKPRRREVRFRATSDVTRGLLGLSRIAYWEVFAAQAAADFVAGRWGAAVSRTSRLRAYAGLREFLRADASLRPALRDELTARVMAMSTNPLDHRPEGEVPLARSQYEALVREAKRPGAFARKLERDRSKELTRLAHGHAARVWLRAASVASLGLYRHGEKIAEPVRERLDRERRIVFHRRFLERVAGSGPRIDVVWDSARVRTSAAELQRLTQNGEAWTNAEGVLAAIARRLPQLSSDEIRQAGGE